MIDSIIGAFKTALTKPKLWVPALVVGIVNYAIFLLLFEFGIWDFMLYALFLGLVPQTGGAVVGLPFEIYAMYSTGVNAIIALAAVVFVTTVFMQFFYGDYVRQMAGGKASFGSAFSYGLSSLKKIFGLFLFFFVITILAGIVMWLAMLFAASAGIVGDIVIVIVGLLMIYIGLKLLFTVTAIAIDRLTLKEGLKKSWEFSNRFLLRIIVLIIVGGSISYLITSVGVEVADLLGIDIVFIVVFIIFWLFAAAFSNLLLPFYYMRKEHGASFSR